MTLTLYRLSNGSFAAQGDAFEQAPSTEDFEDCCCCQCLNQIRPSSLIVDISGISACTVPDEFAEIAQWILDHTLPLFPTTLLLNRGSFGATAQPYSSCYRNYHYCIWQYRWDIPPINPNQPFVRESVGIAVYRVGWKWVIDTCIGGYGYSLMPWFMGEYAVEDCCTPFTVVNAVTSDDCNTEKVCCQEHNYKWPWGFGGSMSVTPVCDNPLP